MWTTFFHSQITPLSMVLAAQVGSTPTPENNTDILRWLIPAILLLCGTLAGAFLANRGIGPLRGAQRRREDSEARRSTAEADKLSAETKQVIGSTVMGDLEKSVEIQTKVAESAWRSAEEAEKDKAEMRIDRDTAQAEIKEMRSKNMSLAADIDLLRKEFESYKTNHP